VSGQARATTIVGVATGTPDGGVAVVRLSGPEAQDIVARLGIELSSPRKLVRRRLSLGDGGTEDALVVVMPGPSSFTGEDVVELHVHAGARNVAAIVDHLLEAGAVAAGAGEFTRRAFANGRLSLDQAEGIAAVIGAQTEEALRQARRLVAGELGREVEARREAVVDLRAEIEANLDFPEDVDPGEVARWQDTVGELGSAIVRWLAGFESARRARERARIVLAGPVNAGKSSLFNAMLGRARAIVSEIPGTTRDYVEADVELGPHRVTLVDTAGLRAATEAVERAGIALSRDQVEGADVVVWILAADDDSDPPEPETTAEIVRVETKRDRGTRRTAWLGVTHGEGADAVWDRVRTWFAGGGVTAWVGLARHRDRAEEALERLRAAEQALAEDAGLELAAFELAAAEMRLGEITGRTALGPVSQEVQDRIFARFCIGK
jgi:tRNA modification GTPase